MARDGPLGAGDALAGAQETTAGGVRQRSLPLSAVSSVGSLLIARVFVGAATLALFALLAQSLPSAQFGLFGVAWSISYLFAAVVEGGYGLLVVREIARAPAVAGHYLGAFLSVRLVIALVVLALALALGATTGWDSLPALVAMGGTAANLQVVSGAPRDFLIGSDRSELAAGHSILETLGRTVAILAVAAVTTSVTAIFAVAALFHLAWTAVGLALVWRLLAPKGVLDGARAWRSVLRASVPFAGLIVLGAAYTQIDVVIVSTLLPLETVAVFLVASRILAATDYVPEAAWRWAYPRLSRSVAALPRLTSRLAVALLGLGLSVGALVAAASPLTIPVIFGQDYSAAVKPMVLMAGAIPMRYLAHVYGTALSAGGRQGRRTVLFGAVILISIVLELALVARFALPGAAISVTLSSALLTAAMLVAARRAWRNELDTWPAAIAALAGLGVVVLALSWGS